MEESEKKTRRGRKPKAEKPPRTPKKRGRKPKNQALNPIVEKTPKKRGRKPQSKVYNVNKTILHNDKTKLSSNLIMHLRINSKMADTNIQDDEFIENKLFTYKPGLDEPEPYDPDFDNISAVNTQCSNEKYEPIENVNQIPQEQSITRQPKTDIRLKNRRVYTSMQKFLNEWPTSTDVCCFWCCHQFTNSPCAIPERYINNVFKVDGCFCSFNCAAAYLFSTEITNYSMWEKYSCLNLLMKTVNHNCYAKSIRPAPPREALKMFGGYMTIDEFRQNFTKTYKVIKPPVIMICPQIDEFNSSNEIKTSDKKYIPVDQNKVALATQSLRLKRTKPLPNHRMSLEHLLIDNT